MWAYRGAPEPVALDQDGAGQVLLVDLEERGGQRQVTVEPRPVGRSKFRKLELDAGTVASRPSSSASCASWPTRTSSSTCACSACATSASTSTSTSSNASLRARSCGCACATASIAPLSQETVAPPDTILGALTRDFRARIVDHETRGDDDRAAELREALRWACCCSTTRRASTLP